MLWMGPLSASRGYSYPMTAPMRYLTIRKKAAAFVAAHPKRQEVRVVAGALRDGSHYGVARLVEHPDELLGSIDLVPALESAVLETLR